jgi:hypothetical protein
MREETMRIAKLIMLGALAGRGAQAGEMEQSAKQTVTVCMQMEAEMELHLAQAIATKVFAGIGVRLDWRGDQQSCEPGAILISLAGGTRKNFHTGALAFSSPHEGNIQVFYDRVRKGFEARRMPYVLAHVLVHEIAHILQGVSRHSDSGIMKAEWNEKDFNRMAWSQLAFTEEDERLIHLGLAARASRIPAIPGVR